MTSLAPSTIALLALIELYLEQSQRRKAMRPILVFLANHTLRADRVPAAATSPVVTDKTSRQDLRAQRAHRAEAIMSLAASVAPFEALLTRYPATVAIELRTSMLWALVMRGTSSSENSVTPRSAAWRACAGLASGSHSPMIT